MRINLKEQTLPESKHVEYRTHVVIVVAHSNNWNVYRMHFAQMSKQILLHIKIIAEVKTYGDNSP